MASTFVDRRFELHLEQIVESLARGRLLFFLGSGASACHSGAASWSEGSTDRMPTGGELRDYFAGKYRHPGEGQSFLQLTMVTQWVDLRRSDQWLADDLHKVFAAECPPSPVHRFIAELPERLVRIRNSGKAKLTIENPHQFIVTSNYDCLTELAFEERRDETGAAPVQEKLDVVYYCNAGTTDLRKGFYHRKHGQGAAEQILDLAHYSCLGTEDRSMLLKMHGCTTHDEDGSYVATEDHYIEYLARFAGGRLFPAKLERMLTTHDWLFLGYSVRDWNTRVLLNRLWAGKNPSSKHAIMDEIEITDDLMLTRYGIQAHQMDLAEYVKRLSAAIDIQMGG